MFKSLIWRIIGVFWLGGITYIFTHNWITVGLVTVIHHATFLVVFYLHERAWLKSQWDSKWKFVIKALTYEIILGNVVLGFITYMITGDIKTMTLVTMTYTSSKLVLYFFYDWAWKKKKVVYAYVVADLLHMGHLIHLERAKRQGDYLIVGVLTDEACMEKKPRPIIGYQERRAIIRALKCVDQVVTQFEYSPMQNIYEIKPDVLMESTSHDEQPANEFVARYGGEVVVSEYFTGESSIKIKDRIGNRLQEALDYATSIVQSYKTDADNLARGGAIGFCQEKKYKEALDTIEKLKK